MNNKEQYLVYKKQYLALKKQLGGDEDDDLEKKEVSQESEKEEGEEEFKDPEKVDLYLRPINTGGKRFDSEVIISYVGNIHDKILVSDDRKHIFWFTHDNQKGDINKYFSSGAMTAIYHVEDILDENKEYIVRMFDPINDFSIQVNIDSYIEKWKSDKQKYPDNIINIYYSGIIYDENNYPISKYVITDKYNNNVDLLGEGIDNQIIFLKNIQK